VKTSEKFFVSYVSLIFVMARTFTAVFIDNGKKRFFVNANAFKYKIKFNKTCENLQQNEHLSWIIITLSSSILLEMDRITCLCIDPLL